MPTFTGGPTAVAVRVDFPGMPPALTFTVGPSKDVHCGAGVYVAVGPEITHITGLFLICTSAAGSGVSVGAALGSGDGGANPTPNDTWSEMSPTSLYCAPRNGIVTNMSV